MSSVLTANKVTKTFKQKKALDEVSMDIKKGDIYGLIGKNGAGKTTLIRIICGLAAPTGGDIKLFDSSDLVSARKEIGTVIESPAFYPNMTAKQNLMAQCKLMGVKNTKCIPKILHMVGLEGTDKKKAKNFSLGMKQRLAIALSLVGEPKFLVLDEPTNGLDPEGIKEIRELILTLNEKYEITVLISSHILSELSKIATRYGMLHEGKLLEEFTEEDLWKKCSENQNGELDLESYFLQVIGGNRQ